MILESKLKFLYILSPKKNKKKTQQKVLKGNQRLSGHSNSKRKYTLLKFLNWILIDDLNK